MQVVVPHRDDATFSCSLPPQNWLVDRLDLALVNIFTIIDYALSMSIARVDCTGEVLSARVAKDEVSAARLLKGGQPAAARLRCKDARILPLCRSAARRAKQVHASQVASKVAKEVQAHSERVVRLQGRMGAAA